MNNQPINVHTHKHLGVFLSSDCQWCDHLDYIKSKALSRINLMRRFKLNLSENHSKLCTSLLFFHFLSMPMLYGIIEPSTG